MALDKNRTVILRLRSIISLIILIVLGAFLLWAVFNLDLPEPEEMREIILGYGWAGFLVFLGITAAIAITPIPITVPALVAGSLYGLIIGTLLSVSGVMLGSWIGYWLARALGQRLTFQLLGSHGSIVENYLRNAGFWAMCTVRLMPGLPYWPVNYGAGALGIKQYAFISATLLGFHPRAGFPSGFRCLCGQSVGIPRRDSDCGVDCGSGSYLGLLPLLEPYKAS